MKINDMKNDDMKTILSVIFLAETSKDFVVVLIVDFSFMIES